MTCVHGLLLIKTRANGSKAAKGGRPVLAFNVAKFPEAVKQRGLTPFRVTSGILMLERLSPAARRTLRNKNRTTLLCCV